MTIWFEIVLFFSACNTADSLTQHLFGSFCQNIIVMVRRNRKETGLRVVRTKISQLLNQAFEVLVCVLVFSDYLYYHRKSILRPPGVISEGGKETSMMQEVREYIPWPYQAGINLPSPVSGAHKLHYQNLGVS